ncbi:MAG: molybdopterin-dependent oxidoreductase [Deltaproteobacteria bacterium]|nr:molybdopterin-dependent oxidoreductase [Deltaproteobacteria bacterium]
MQIGRRRALGLFAGAGAWVVGCGDDDTSVGAAIASTPALCRGIEGGVFVRVVPFDGEGPAVLGVPTGAGLDGRLYDDLSTLEVGSLVTPTSRFYVRTRYPDRLDPAAPWRVAVGGLVERELVMSLEEITSRAGARGVHVLECSGNGSGAAFGMLSAAAWEGAPLLPLLRERARWRPEATRVLVSGFDDHSQPSARSTAGASWIFTTGELEATGAFLATKMNGEPLPRDHGAPLRLVVPGWYGCASIKWVNEIVLVGEGEPATSHMREFASRTMQSGTPELARDFRPAEIDAAAMPVRVEEWRVGERRVYRVLGLAWGARPLAAAPSLAIRMNADRPYEPVAFCASPPDGASWSWWGHAFETRRPGPHEMRLAYREPGLRTRRLDSGFYARTVTLA